MHTPSANIIRFPLDRRRTVACPQCGTYTDVEQVGRLTWAYCDTHGVRWVVADRRTPSPGSQDLSRVVEFLATFTEVTVI